MTGSFATSGLFGALWRDDEMAALFSAPAQVAAMIAFERAWTEALGETGRAAPDLVAQALAHLDGFAPDLAAIAGAAERDGLPVPELIRQIRAGAGAAASAIHHGATSQDVMDFALVRSLQGAGEIIDARAKALGARIEALRAAFGARPLMGWTRMQAALPITVDHRLAVWSAGLTSTRLALGDALEDVAQVQAFGPVGAGDDDLARAVADRLCLRAGPVWHAERSDVHAVGHALTALAIALGKIGQDTALMAQQGVEAVVLRGGGGSSAMPHKQNPIRAEALVSLQRFVAAQQGALLQGGVHEAERSGAAWALEWLTLPVMLEALGAALRSAQVLLDQIEALGDGATRP